MSEEFDIISVQLIRSQSLTIDLDVPKGFVIPKVPWRRTGRWRRIFAAIAAEPLLWEDLDGMHVWETEDPASATFDARPYLLNRKEGEV